MDECQRARVKTALFLLVLITGAFFLVRALLPSREEPAVRYTDMAELLAICDSGDALAVKRALPQAGTSALRTDGTTLLHVLLERDPAPEVLREVLSPQSPLFRMVQLADAQGRRPLHIAAARANPAALLLLRCAGARDLKPDAEGRLALDIVLGLSDAELNAHLPFWENRGKREQVEVIDLLRSKNFRLRGKDIHVKSKGFVSYVSLATNAGEISYVAAVQAAAVLQPEDGHYLLTNNDSDLPYIHEYIGIPPPTGNKPATSPRYWRNGGFQSAESGRRAALIKCLWPEASPLMLRIWTDPAFRNEQDRLDGVFLAEWIAWDIPGDVLGPMLLERNERLREQSKHGGTVWFRSSDLSTSKWYNRNSMPAISVWLLLAGLPDGVALSPKVREAAPALATLCDLRAALGREDWKTAGPHLCAAAWLEQLTPTDKLLQTVMDNWRDPVDVKTAFQGWNGAHIVPQGRWQRPDALRCWAAGWASQGTDAGDPFVKVASVLGHVDEATGRRIVRMMLASGAKPDLADRTGTLPREAARLSGASESLLKLLEAPSPPPPLASSPDNPPPPREETPS